jgi:hypothetical protein
MNLPSNEFSIQQNVILRKQTIISEISTCVAKHAQLKQELSDIEGFLRIFSCISLQDSIQPEISSVALSNLPEKTTKRNKTELIARSAIDFLSDGQVLSTSQILEKLAQRGILVGGKNQAANLSAILSKTEQIVNSRAAKGWMRLSTLSNEVCVIDESN